MVRIHHLPPLLVLSNVSKGIVVFFSRDCQLFRQRHLNLRIARTRDTERLARRENIQAFSQTMATRRCSRNSQGAFESNTDIECFDALVKHSRLTGGCLSQKTSTNAIAPEMQPV